MRWTRRIGIGAGLAVGAMALSIGTGFAAGVSSSSSDGARSESAAVDAGAVKISHAKTYADENGSSASWAPVTVDGKPVLIRNTPSGWAGEASAVGDLVDQVNKITCPTGNIQVPVNNTSVCARVLSSITYAEPSGAYAYGDLAEALVLTDGAAVLATVLESHAASGYCDDGFGFAAPVVVLSPATGYLFPADMASTGCFELAEG